MSSGPFVVDAGGHQVSGLPGAGWWATSAAVGVDGDHGGKVGRRRSAWHLGETWEKPWVCPDFFHLIVRIYGDIWGDDPWYFFGWWGRGRPVFDFIRGLSFFLVTMSRVFLSRFHFRTAFNRSSAPCERADHFHRFRCRCSIRLTIPSPRIPKEPLSNNVFY